MGWVNGLVLLYCRLVSDLQSSIVIRSRVWLCRARVRKGRLDVIRDRRFMRATK
jgi:hypothetical protein